MVIVQLIGGLGNQMFQYAIARRISYLNNTSLQFDISDFKYYKDQFNSIVERCFDTVNST